MGPIPSWPVSQRRNQRRQKSGLTSVEFSPFTSFFVLGFFDTFWLFLLAAAALRSCSRNGKGVGGVEGRLNPVTLKKIEE